MRSTISDTGQTEILAEIRRRIRLTSADRLEWIAESEGIRVVPVRASPIEAFRGSGKGGGTRRLLEERRQETTKE